MFGLDWATSERRYRVVVDRDLVIPLSDGTELVGDVFRPDTSEAVPVIAGFHPYNNEFQTSPVFPEGFSLQRGWMESGDPTFFARRGYAHGIFNVRGTGKSGGWYQAMGPQESADVAEAIGWLAAQEWSTGDVGLFGISYFAWLQIQTAMREPPALRAIFAPFGATDFYRDFLYHGGILSYRFLVGWKDKLDGLRYRSWYAARHGHEAFSRAAAAALEDDEIAAVPELVAALRDPIGSNALVADVVLCPLDTDWWEERRVDYSHTGVPAYLGACWGLNGLHLPAAFRSFERWEGPRVLLVGPDVYLDRPLYQLQYESLRWFDHWLKGIDTGMLREPPVRLFVAGTGRWRTADRWPLPETRWTPFYLHSGGLLSEHDTFASDTATSFEDSPFVHGAGRFATPELVEETELLGPAVMDLYLSTTDSDALVMVAIFVVDVDGGEREISRGWLRASQRALCPRRSRPWAPYHLHEQRQPLVDGEIFRLQVEIAGVSARLHPGQRLAVVLKLADDEPPPDPLRATGFGHLQRQAAALVRIHHDEEHASALVLPVVEGNVLGTFISGGRLPRGPKPIPTAKIVKLKSTSAPGPGPAGDG
ncbi:MAG: CocE/NonD family hydrolase [Acidimicrobiales bacterium]